MDKRHVEFIYDLALVGKFKNILEIGCFNGSSTAALVQARNDGADFHLTLCDLLFRPSLFKVLQSNRSVHPITLLQRASWNVISSHYDLIIVDGDHRLQTVSTELELILKCHTPTVIAHDVSNSYEQCEGARMLGETLQDHPAFFSILDSEQREGENTDRGVLFASRDKILFDKMLPYWKQRMTQ